MKKILVSIIQKMNPFDEFDDNTDVLDEIEEIIEIETNFEDLRNAVLSKAK